MNQIYNNSKTTAGLIFLTVVFTLLSGAVRTLADDFAYAESNLYVEIPSNGNWAGSGMQIDTAPAGATVTSVDIHYEIESSWVGYVYAELSDQDYYFTHGLVDGVNGSISQTKTGITTFNGRPVNQEWVLWAREELSSGGGYISSWWIKVYYYSGPPTYCSASGGCVEHISRVEVGSIDNSSGCDGYADYTAISTEMQIGQDYGITVTNGDPYQGQDYCGIWVDWNQDKDFADLGETIAVAGNPGDGPYTATITPPVYANLGETRMRVRIAWNQNPGPCDNTSYGEVEDYTINVTGAPSFVTISGYVRTADSNGIEDVLITGTNGIGSTMTDVNGYYELTTPTNPWSGQITPSRTYWDFFPDTWGLVSVTHDTPNIDFEGTYNYNYGGGQGTVGIPYLIYTPEHMNEIGVNLDHWDDYFKLMADIDLGGYTGTAFNIIGNVNDGPFSGWFNGNGHKISNFTYSSTGTDRIGLFGEIDGFLTVVENLTLINPYVNAGTGERVGALVGRLSNSSKIVSCQVIGGSVSGAYAVGGLAGSQRESSIEHCFSSSSVSGGWEIGGLVGMVWRASVSHSYSTGPVQGTQSYIGGLAGSVSEGGIYDCYATGSVSGDDNVGGLVGELYAFSQPALIRNCYAAGLVSSSGYTGGLIAFNYVDAGTVLDSFWDVNSSGQTTSGGGTGKTTAEMQMESTYIDVGWDFSTPVWEICEGTNYPKLAWQISIAGDFMCPDGVDFIDYSFFAGHWLEENCAGSNDCEGIDLDQLGAVDINDLKIFANNWLAGVE